MAWKQYSEMIDSDRVFDSPLQRYIFLEACYRSDKRNVVRLSQVEFAQITGCSLRTITIQFGKLQEQGLLKREGHGKYRLSLPTVAPGES